MLTFVFFLIDRRNQFAWVSKTSGAQFVHINLVQSNTCKDIFEYILANSHLNVWYVSKNSIDKIIVTLIWENVFNNFMNLELNKYCYLLKKIKIIFFFLFNWQKEPIHLSYMEFGCPFCPKKSGTKQHMQYHIRIHTGEKPFKCFLCNKKFTQKSSCDLHIRTVHQKMNSWI